MIFIIIHFSMSRLFYDMFESSVSSDDTSSSLSLSPSQSPLGSWQQEGMRRMSLVRHGSYNTNNNSYINPTSFSTNFNNLARANASQQNMILPTISVSLRRK